MDVKIFVSDTHRGDGLDKGYLVTDEFTFKLDDIVCIHSSEREDLVEKEES